MSALGSTLRSVLGSMAGQVRAIQGRATQGFGAVAASPMFNNLQSRWQLLSNDGQRLIQFSAALLALALVWAFLWLPATRQRAALGLRIPVLQNQLATMRAQADEIKRVQAMPTVLTTNTRTLADTTGLQIAFGDSAKVALDESRQFRVTINNMAYTNWLDHLDAALNRYRLRVVSVSLKPQTPQTPVGGDANKTVINAGNNTVLNITLVLADDAPGK